MNNSKKLFNSHSQNNSSDNLSFKSTKSLRTIYKIDYSSPRLNIFPLSYINSPNNNKNIKNSYYYNNNYNTKTFHSLSKNKKNNINLKINTHYNYVYKNVCPHCFNENLIKLNSDNKSRNLKKKFIKENNTFLDPLKTEIENKKNRVINIREINALKSIKNSDFSRKNIIENCQMNFSNDNFFKNNKEYGIEREKKRNINLFNFGFKYNEFVKLFSRKNMKNLNDDKNYKNKKNENNKNEYINKNEYKNILNLQMKINNKKKRDNEKREKKLDLNSYGLNFSAMEKKRCDLCKKNYKKNLLSNIIFKK